jgi:LysR family carnitine catabolism transcriptional activator
MRHAFSLRQIEGFLLASELRSFSRAAEAMHISQSAFSQLVRELETSLGVRLFDRTTRSIAMTTAGEAMYRKMSKGMEAIDEACEEARAIARMERGHLTLGAVSSLAPGIVTRALGRLRREFPGVTVSLHEGLNDELVGRVAKGELDLAICSKTAAVPGLDFDPLFMDELVVVAPSTYRHTNVKQLKWADLDQESFIVGVRHSSVYELIAEAMAKNDIVIGTEYETANIFTSLSMVKAGFGFAFLPQIVSGDVNMDGLAAIRIENPPTRQIGVYRQSERTASPAATKFEDFLRFETAEALSKFGAM